MSIRVFLHALRAKPLPRRGLQRRPMDSSGEGQS